MWTAVTGLPVASTISVNLARALGIVSYGSSMSSSVLVKDTVEDKSKTIHGTY
jgi:hypothetical protein